MKLTNRISPFDVATEKKVRLSRVTARFLEVASDFISIRSVMRRSGGAKLLRSLPYSDALSRMRKAARELQSERRGKGINQNLNQGELTAWCRENCKGKASSLKPDTPPKVNPPNKPKSPAKPATPLGVSKKERANLLKAKLEASLR